jgi:SAM-dependent methyltransferase
MWSPHERLPGGFSPNDGTIDFYSRINTLAAPDRVLLDVGAGRGAWHEDDTNEFRKSLRYLKEKFRHTIAIDVDSAVLNNRTVDKTAIIEDGIFPVDDGEVDVIVCDYVLEHVEDVAVFVSEVNRVLKPGGWFCARTPHKYHYVALASRIMGERIENKILARAQPMRKEMDVFAKRYFLNTRSSISAAFKGWQDHSFIFRCDPAYYFHSRFVYGAQDFFHRIMPSAVSGNIFVFLKKPGGT